jgi:predicted phage-related endonuclease
MKIIPNLIQGSAAWHEHRRFKWNASEAPAMLGESVHESRSDFLRRRATGIEPEVDGATQKRFDRGHTVEPLLIKMAEERLGEPLHPFVAVADFDDRYSASFDGCTFVGDMTAECKLLNARLRAAFADMQTIAPEHREASAGKSLPIDYRIQLEQQLRVAEAERCLFITGELRDDGTLGDVFSCWYYPDEALWARIQAGWPQFEEDRAAYVPPAASAVEKIVAEPVEALPAPVVQVSGQLTLQDNFKVFEERLRHFLEHRLIREPKTDQDFVDLDAQIKAMKQAREALGAAEAQMLAQVQPVDQAKKTKDMLDKLLQQNVSMAEKLLTAEKDRRRSEIVMAGVSALKRHIDALNARLGKPYMPVVPADFAGAVKGLKSLASMEDKVSTELARAKIAANEIADRIQINLTWLRENAKDHTALFPDTGTIVLKAHDDLVVLAKLRIAEHKAAEERRLEAERERIRKEEQAKAEKAAREKVEAEQREQRQRESEQSQQRAVATAQEIVAIANRTPAEVAAPASQAANVVPMQRPTAAPTAPPTLRLGVINERLAPLQLTADGLTALGFPPAGKERSAVLYHEHQFEPICEAIERHAGNVRERHARQAA